MNSAFDEVILTSFNPFRTDGVFILKANQNETKFASMIKRVELGATKSIMLTISSEMNDSSATTSWRN